MLQTVRPVCGAVGIEQEFEPRFSFPEPPAGLIWGGEGDQHESGIQGFELCVG